MANITCTCCGASKPPTTGFYISRSNLYKNNSGRMPICKSCLSERYEDYMRLYQDDKLALYHLCMNFDIYFDEELFDSSFTQDNFNNEKDSVLKIYIKNINSLKQYKNMSSLNSNHIVLDSKVLSRLEEKYKIESEEIKEEKSKKENLDYENIKITKTVKKRWGSGYSNEDYIFLEDSYQEFYDAYPHDTPAERLLLVQLSKTLLEGEICRREGDRTGYEKMSKLVSSMLTDSNIKPSQKKTMGDEVGECFGVFIENVEKNEPIGESIEEFEDVDGIGKYIDKHFVKNFAKIFGLVGDDNEDED